MSDDDRSSADNGQQSSGEGRTIKVQLHDTLGFSENLTHYVYSSYGKRWWEDACGEVPLVDDEDAARHVIRRQVVFVVCALESWFFEWVRDEVPGDVNATAALFAEGKPEGITDRIKRVTKQLYDESDLIEEPDFDDTEAWQPLCGLVEHRNGLVHALASLPRGDIPPDAETATPTPEDLRDLAPAKPLRIVRRAVELVTSFADAEPPEWMEVSVAASLGRTKPMAAYRIEFKWAAGIGYTWSWSRGVHPRPQTVEADSVRCDGDEYVFVDRDGSSVTIVRKEIVREIIRE